MNETGLLTNTTTIVFRCGWPREAPVYSNNKYLYILTYPVLLLMASVGNILNLIILSRERPRNSKHVYLIALAVSDFAFMWSDAVPYLNDVIKVPCVRAFHSQLAGICVYSQDLYAFTSDWIIVAFTVDRFLAIKSPLQHIIIGTSKRSSIIVLGIVFLAAVVSLDDLVDYYWFFFNDLGDGPLAIRPTALAQWRLVFSKALVLIPIVTFVVILLLNAFLIRILSHERKHRRLKLQASISSSSDREPPKSCDRSALVMLSACVLLYVVCQSPSFASNIMSVLDYECVRRRTRAVVAQFDPIRLFFMNLNYSLNFYLYCGVSPLFRRSLSILITESCSGRSRRPIHSSVRSDFSRVYNPRNSSYYSSETRL